jgi:hypothetical protein
LNYDLYALNMGRLLLNNKLDFSDLNLILVIIYLLVSMLSLQIWLNSAFQLRFILYNLV